MLKCNTSHLLIHHELAQQCFANQTHVYVSYQKHKNILLITPVSSGWFKKMYNNTIQLLIKTRNLIGDKSINIQGILIDYSLEIHHDNVNFKYIKKTNLLKVYF